MAQSFHTVNPHRSWHRTALRYEIATDGTFGVEYDEFGNVTGLPGAYAGGKLLSSTYYADNTAASLSQDGTTIEYMLDPAGRARESLTSDAEGESSLVSHFAGDGDSPAWTEDNSGSWTRYIGCMGGMAATQSSTEGLEFQLANLHGDVVGTMGSEAEELVFAGGSTEYGSPSGGAQLSKYAWLGAAQRSTELASGVIGMGARTYVPQIGRFLQADPVPGGSANRYAYVFGDPVNESDLSGEYTSGAAPVWLVEFMENPPGMPPPPLPPVAEAEEVQEFITFGQGSSEATASHWCICGGGGTKLKLPKLHLANCSVSPPIGWGKEAANGAYVFFGALVYSCHQPVSIFAHYIGAGKPGAISEQHGKKHGVLNIEIHFQGALQLSYCVLIVGGGDSERHCGGVNIVTG